MNNKEKEHLLYGVLGIGGIVGALFFLSSNKNAVRSPQVHTPITRTVTPNPNQASLDQAIVAARTEALQFFDAGVLGQKTLTEQQNVAYNTNSTQKLIAFNTNAAQTAQARIQATAAQIIAQTAATAQEQAASTQAAAEEAAANAASQASQAQSSSQSTSNIFDTIFGGIASIFTGGFFNMGQSVFNPSIGPSATSIPEQLPPVFSGGF